MNKGIVLAGLAMVLALALAACGPLAEPGLAPAAERAMGEGGERLYDENDTSSGYDASQAPVEQMIIWNADLTLTVADTTEAMQQVQAVARDLGGRTIGSESWLLNDQLYARLTIRLPAEKFEEAMARLRDLALEVKRESASSEDVTEQYVDLASQLRHLEAKEAQLLEFLDEAEDTEAVLAVYEHLAETQAEIEQVTGRMEYLKNLSDMATISVELYPEEAELPVIEEGWKPGRTLRDAARSLVNTLEGLADAVIWLAVYLLPVLLLIGLPIGVVVWAIRTWRRRRRQRQATQNQGASPTEEGSQ